MVAEMRYSHHRFVTGWCTFLWYFVIETQQRGTHEYVWILVSKAVAQNEEQCLTAKLLFSNSFLLLLCRPQGWRAEVGHDHEELLKADLLEGAHLVFMLVPESQMEEISI